MSQASTPSRGFGDTLEKAITAISRGTVKSCDKCKQRRDALNRLMPYRKCTSCDKAAESGDA